MQKTRIDRVFPENIRLGWSYEDDIQPEIQVPPPRKKHKSSVTRDQRTS